MNDRLTKKIMYEVAKKERSDLLSSVLLLMPAVIALIFVALVCSHRAISNLSSKGFFDLIVEFDFDIYKFYPQIFNIGQKLWEEVVRGFLLGSAVSSAAAFFILKKSKLYCFPTRIKEIGKYFNETNFLLYRINK